MNKKIFNRLENEQSLYLKQHATNPVDWWPYGPEAISKAQDENKPIFLSVGYSSCHYCHVMARESFENQNTANILNEHFICIKIDREEYPDLDHFYQMAAHLYMKRNGWPLSVFLLPDMRPFFAGTYFPATPVNNVASFEQVLLELSDIFHNNRQLAEENAKKVFDAINEGMPKQKVEFEGHYPHPMAIINALKEFEDKENGGHGNAPKFANFSFHEWAIEQMLEGMINKEAGAHVTKTLDSFLMGAIYDQIRGGIHRYATDQQWNKPHFEKMLYDQAGLLKLLSKTCLIHPSPLVYDSLIQTLDYLNCEMNKDDHYFFSAQNAESEGVEGLFYLFTEEEFEAALKPHLEDKISQYKSWFNITKQGNFLHGLNGLSLCHSKKDELFSAEGWKTVREIKQILLTERKNRIPPQTDIKGVASWNFALISSLLDVIQYCPIESIKGNAQNLYERFITNVEKVFIENHDPFMINHTTTKKSAYTLCEDSVLYCELLLRSYEVFGLQEHLEKFLKTLVIIRQEYLAEDTLFYRPIKCQDQELYPNQRITAFDNSFRSASSILVQLCIKGALLSKNQELLLSGNYMERIINESLLNPLGSGEALRVLTYPIHAYKVVQVPRSWHKDPRFKQFMTYFMPRFTFSYHDEDQDSWQICSSTACELKGIGFQEFEESLRPKKNV